MTKSIKFAQPQFKDIDFISNQIIFGSKFCDIRFRLISISKLLFQKIKYKTILVNIGYLIKTMSLRSK